MKTKRKTSIIILVIFIFAFLAANLGESKYFNFGVDYLNSKFNLQNSKFKLPHFWEKPFKLGLDLVGGTHLVYQADLASIEEKNRGEAMEGLRDVIERRVNLFGVKEPLVQIEGEKLIVELAGVKDIQEAIRMIGQTPYLEFREKRPDEETQKILDKAKEAEGKNFEEIQKLENWHLAFEDPYFKATQLTGKYLKRSELGFDQTSYKPLILLQFNDEGAKIFEELTSKNVGKPLAIYIDNQILSAPVVQETISGGRAQITGEFTIQRAKALVKDLNAGALPVPITLISQQNVGPSLGEISLRQSLKAGIIGFLAVILFMILVYRLAGVLADLALLTYIAFLLALFKLIPVTLTLSGIAGFLLSIGMAVDANILTFARIREELKTGKNFGLALEEGFSRSWPSIRDSNLTTLIIGLILFSFGSGFVKGFALTLSLGILLSMFSAIIITRNLLKIFEKTRFEKIKWLWL